MMKNAKEKEKSFSFQLINIFSNVISNIFRSLFRNYFQIYCINKLVYGNGFACQRGFFNFKSRAFKNIHILVLSVPMNKYDNR